MGKVEKAGGLWKEVFEKTVLDMQLQGIQDVILATSVVTQNKKLFCEIVQLLSQFLGAGEARDQAPYPPGGRAVGSAGSCRRPTVGNGTVPWKSGRPQGLHRSDWTPTVEFVGCSPSPEHTREDLTRLGATFTFTDAGAAKTSSDVPLAWPSKGHWRRAGGTPPGWPTTCLLAALFCDLRG